MSDKSDTPRTDNFVSIRRWEDGQEPLDAWAKFARQLERELTAAAQQLSALRQQLEAEREDVERYRWLREHGSRYLTGADEIGIRVFDFPPDADWIFGDLDSAIDAAIRGGER